MEKTVVSDFQYTTPIILNFNYKCNINLGKKSWQINIQHKKNIQRDAEKHAFVTLTMRISSTEDSSPFEVEFSIMSQFKWNDVNEDDLKILLNRNAPSILVGYARPYVAMMTNSSSIPSFNLPLINFSNETLDDISIKTN